MTLSCSRPWLLVVLAACGATPEPAIEPLDEPLSTEAHRAWEHAASTQVPEPARGGPAISSGASPLPPFTQVDRGSARYVGVGQCSACHPDVAEPWVHSAHAEAWDTLEAEGSEHDPRCLPCHVTGMGHPGGFPERPQDETLVGVQCEACHGPGSDHVSAPQAAYGSILPGGSACVACHTHDTSPDFRWETHWPAVDHPRKPVAP